MLKIGETAPDFTIATTKGLVTLSNLVTRFNKVVLLFYIEDGTPVNAELSPATRRYFEAQALRHHGNPDSTSFALDGQTDGPASEEYVPVGHRPGFPFPSSYLFCTSYACESL